MFLNAFVLVTHKDAVIMFRPIMQPIGFVRGAIFNGECPEGRNKLSCFCCPGTIFYKEALRACLDDPTLRCKLGTNIQLWPLIYS